MRAVSGELRRKKQGFCYEKLNYFRDSTFSDTRRLLFCCCFLEYSWPEPSAIESQIHISAINDNHAKVFPKSKQHNNSLFMSGFQSITFPDSPSILISDGLQRGKFSTLSSKD